MRPNLTFLGTSAGVPSPERSLPSLTLRYEQWILMFDCGEGTQRQMMRARIGLSKPMKIFITHLHGDHFFGLLGLLQTMNLLGRERGLEIYGPIGLKGFLEPAMDYSLAGLKFPLEIREISSGSIVKERNFKVRARLAKHSIPNLAYSFEEGKRPGKFHVEEALRLRIPKGPLWHKLQHGQKVKLPDGRMIEPNQVVDPPKPGIKMVYSGDTKPCRAILELARGADLLVHECTFDDSLSERAETEYHSTPSGAATLALKAGVKQLVLTHLSTRYRGDKMLLEQARRLFPNTLTARDLMKLEL